MHTRILFFGLLISAGLLRAQQGSVSGLITDPSHAAVPGARVAITNVDTHITESANSNESGRYTIPSLLPGHYEMEITKEGFRPVKRSNIAIEVGAELEVDFVLSIGDANQSVTVSADSDLLQTVDGTVSTVVDRRFVEDVPLNGRSFQSLILLAPGIVSNTPQSQGALGYTGEFSVNGQRTESNVYLVDGVTATGGVYGYVQSPAGPGAVPASTALGTTQGLVSVDALQEFRVLTSTYSAEYGRAPGGQFSFATRSGTNDYHGTAFDYLRNSDFDANNWFNNQLGQPKLPLRQNDFGGTFGGPVRITRLYSGKDRTFFFFSYEGLRLLQSAAAAIYYVPSLQMRQAAAPVLQPILNSFPLPTGPALSNGLAPYVGGIGTPGSLDSISLRLDHNLNSNVRLFFRFSDAPSSSATPFVFLPTDLEHSNFTTRSYTWGLTASITPRITDELRFNFGQNWGTFLYTLSSNGGAQPADLAALTGINTKQNPAWELDWYIYIPGYYAYLVGGNSSASQQQWNLRDTVAWARGRHQFKFGIDYLQTEPEVIPPNPDVGFGYASEAELISNSAASAESLGEATSKPEWNLFGAFVQDEWRPTARLNLSLGLRWELDPPPSSANGHVPYILQGDVNNPSSLSLAATPLWHTTYHNFAPRLGLAYKVVDKPGRETVFRAGGGVFYDTGEQDAANAYTLAGFRTNGIYPGASFPLTSAQQNLSIPTPPVPPYSNLQITAFPSHFQQPYTLQWNASIQQALGPSQTFTITYVGSAGRRMLQERFMDLAGLNPNFGLIYLYQGGVTSDYDALQMQFQRRITHGLQALASYTWSHALDYGSTNTTQPETRGNSDFDVRHNLTGALSYDVPQVHLPGFAHALLNHWGFDDRLMARTGFPVLPQGNFEEEPGTGAYIYSGLNTVPGVPIYLYGPQYPGGREINPAAFTVPPGTDPATAPRNFLRGFGAVQMDLAVRRELPIYERLRLQFRAEAFNVLNHPNFGLINTTYGNPQFGQATQTLNQSIGVLSPLYQQGGPRSIQLSLKLIF
jgi:hypothetical protein